MKHYPHPGGSGPLLIPSYLSNPALFTRYKVELTLWVNTPHRRS